MPFPEPIRTKVLLWSDRHCCLCKKSCGAYIEVHHIVPEEKGGASVLENAIPLCFDCHGAVCSYNVAHPRGTKFKAQELKSRREQVYEEFTRHLIPPVEPQITQQQVGSPKLRDLPDVGFNLIHRGSTLPVRVRVKVESKLGETRWRAIASELYNGKRPWNLNPGFGVFGHFKLDSTLIPRARSLELRVSLAVIDVYEREHGLLPISFVHEKNGNFWWMNP